MIPDEEIISKQQICEIQVERPLRQKTAITIMRQQNITLSRYKKLYNPEVDFFVCGNRARFKVTHHINIRGEKRIQFCCGIHKNQLVELSRKSDLLIKVEESTKLKNKKE